MMCSSASLQVCLDAGEATGHPVPLGRGARARPAAGRAVRQLPPPRRRRHPLGLRPAAVRPAHLPAGHPAAGHDGRRPRAALGPPGHGGAGDLPAPRRRVVGRAGGAHLRGLDRGRRRAASLPVPTTDDLDYHLSTMFPPVRPRGYLEIRYLDAQPGDDLGPPVRAASALSLSSPRAGRRGAGGHRTGAGPVARGGPARSARTRGSAPRQPRVVDLGCAAVADLDLAPATVPPCSAACPSWSPPRAGGARHDHHSPAARADSRAAASPRRRGAHAQPRAQHRAHRRGRRRRPGRASTRR